MSMEEIKEITECCICTEFFADPRMLPCIHTFCYKCLEETAEKADRRPGNDMPCPLCRKDFTIPAEGTEGLPRNFFMERLVEIAKSSKLLEKTILCEICMAHAEKEAKELPQAVQYCVQCHKNICDRCCQDHGRFQELKEHQIVQLGSSMKRELFKNVSAQNCDLHTKQEADIYCTDCRRVICTTCLGEKHKTHNCSDIKKVASEFRNQVVDDIEKMNYCSRQVFVKIEKLVKEQKEFQKRMEELEKVIIKRSNKLKERIDKFTRSLLNELASIGKETSETLEGQRSENERQGASIGGFETYCHELISMGTSTEICRAFTDLHSRAEELERLHDALIQREIPSVQISFEPSKFEDLMRTENTIGSIRAEKKVRTEESKPKPEENNSATQVSILTRTKLNLSSSSDVCGVSKLVNIIYVLCRRPSSLCAFEDRVPFRLEQTIKLKKIQNPHDIVSSEKLNCLFIADESSGCIWKTTADGDSITKWLFNAFCPYSMSVSIDGGNVLILRDGLISSQLEIYDPDAKLVRSLTLHKSIQEPLYGFQKANGEFIISHRLRDGWNERWVISQLTSDGQKIVGQSKYSPKDKTQKLNRPRYFALDSDNSRLFVADSKNNRVVVFDYNTLSHVQVLPTKDKSETQRPRRLHYDAKKKQLIVGQTEDRVNIYEFK